MTSSIAALPPLFALLAVLPAVVLSCSGSRAEGASTATPAAPPIANESDVTRVLDDWHDAAAHSDEERYFGHLTPDAIFIGTDATERWDVKAFRAYAHEPFSKGKGWVMRATARHVMFADGGKTAWFDEELDAKNLGAARGSGVLVRGDDGTFRIAHYVLSVSVPNEKFKAVKELLEAK
jgi:ketosteroid isomerase-like protein